MALELSEFLSLSPYFVDTDKTPGFNWQKFQDKIDLISENLFNLLVEESTAEFIKSLTEKYSQINGQSQNLARLVRDIILADIFIGDMPAEISKQLAVDQNTGREIANQIVAQIFAPVLEEIKKSQAVKFPTRIAKRQNPVPSGPIKPVPGADLPETGGNIIDLRKLN